jgi:hypothetical protein
MNPSPNPLMQSIEQLENTHGKKNLINDKCKNVVQYCAGCLPPKEPRRHDSAMLLLCGGLFIHLLGLGVKVRTKCNAI